MRVETERMGGDITAEYKDGQLYIMERIIMQNERNKKDMKNKLFLMIMVVMVCSLTACGQQENGSMTNTGNSTEQVVTSEDNSELATAEDNNMEQTEAKEQEVVQLPDEPSMDDSSSSTEKFENKDNWPDVEELVNQRGDETTVYLLADGRYMDRINAVYIYDGKTIPKSKIS